jgi:hypothetical protein
MILNGAKIQEHAKRTSEIPDEFQAKLEKDKTALPQNTNQRYYAPDRNEEINKYQNTFSAHFHLAYVKSKNNQSHTAPL